MRSSFPTPRWLLAGAVCCFCILAQGGCESPQASGTKTNWLGSCETSIECAGEGTCLCGVCTLSCASDAECETGRCGSSLTTAAQCSEEAESERVPTRLCVEESRACAELVLQEDTDLSAALPAACDNAGALVCESFEGPLPEEYSTWTGDGIAMLTECDVHGGTGALRYLSADQTTQTRIRLPQEVSAGPLHARFFVKLAGASVITNQLIIFELWDETEVDHVGRVTLAINADGLFAISAGAQDATYVSNGDPMPLDQWACIELALEVSDAAGSLKLQIDGGAVIDQSNIDTRPLTSFGVVLVQSLPSGDTPEVRVDFTVDDLVVATQPIGCD